MELLKCRRAVPEAEVRPQGRAMCSFFVQKPVARSL
jgi:hypothetical protein